MSISRVAKQLMANPMNARSGRTAAVLRFLRYQFAVRLMPSGVVLPFVNGSVLFAQRGSTGVTGNWYGGLHEVDEMGFVLHALRPGDLFVDVGANAGSYTVLAAKGVGAEVIAIEPIPNTFARLTRNVALNGVDASVTCFEGGVSDGPAVIHFTADRDTMNHVAQAGEAGPTVGVQVVTLDDLVGSRRPAVVKIDVEGHELPVLRGADQTLSSSTLLGVVMETNGSGAPYGVSDQMLVDAMARHGFQPFGYEPFSRTLIKPGEANNTIFVRDRAAVEAICKAAPRYTLCNGTI
jgi:FkbM family methyltransferase